MTATENPAKPPRRIGYARVSTASQSTEQQLHRLREAGCCEVFTDNGISATAKNRPGLDQAQAALQEGDIFTVWAIDRAFRSTIEAIKFLDGLMARNIEFQSLTQSIDTRTPEGRKWFIDTASWAEYERAIISRRTREKLAEAKRQGVKLGRRRKLNQTQLFEAKQLLSSGVSVRQVSQKYGISQTTLRRVTRA